MKRIAILAALLLTLLNAAIASAHATVVKCEPTIGTNLSAPPSTLVCHFSEPLDPTSSSLMVYDANGARVDKNDTQTFQNDASSLVVTLDTTKMPVGLYTVRWNVTNTIDYAPTQDQFQLGVQTPVPPTPTPVLPGIAQTPQPIGGGISSGELISRFLIAAGVVVLGATGFYFWRSRRQAGQDE